MNNGRDILIFHSPVLMTIQSVEGEENPWANFSVSFQFELFDFFLFSLQYETRTLKRGLPEMFFNEIKFGDKDPVQHLCFVVHGIGEACDTKFRPLIDCVEDLRETSRTILQTHFKTYVENDQLHRVVKRIFGRCSIHSFSFLLPGISSSLLAWGSSFRCKKIRMMTKYFIVQ